MKVEKVYSLQVADRVLEEITKLAKKVERDLPVDVRVWSNGREQGYHLTAGDNAVVFAENRNSDHILVVVGDKMDFDISTNMPNNKIWEDAMMYPGAKPAHAAQMIMQHLLK